MISRVCPKGNLTVPDFSKDIKIFMSNFSRSFFMLLSLMLGLTWQFNAFAQELDYADKSGKAAEIIKNSKQYQTFLALQKKIAEENGDRPRKFRVLVDEVNAKVVPTQDPISKIGYYAFPKVNFKNKRNKSDIVDLDDLLILNFNGDITYINLTAKYNQEIKRTLDILEKENNLVGLSLKKGKANEKSLKLKGFEKIKFLKLYKESYENVYFYENNSILSLEIFFSPVSDLIGLENLEDLENINLRYVNLKEIDGIKELSKLLRIEISISRNENNYISKLPNLSALKKLEYLGFESKYIKGIKGIDELKSLKTLYVGRKFNYQGIKFPNSLEILHLRGEENEMMPNLKGNVNLIELGISDTSIEKIEDLNDLLNLEKLYMIDNSISSIAGLYNLKELRKISLAGNRIKNIENIENLRSLEDLDLSYNMIESTKGLSKNLNLKRINLEQNKIKKIEDVNNLTNLIVLDLVFNPIEEFDYSSVNNLTNTKIRLSDTPVGDAMTKAEKKKYRKLNKMLFF